MKTNLVRRPLASLLAGPLPALLLALVLAAAAQAAEPRALAVFPIDVRRGALNAAGALALEADLRAAAWDLGVESVAPERLRAAGEPLAVARTAQATHYLLVSAARVEGATVLSLRLFRADTGAQLGAARAAGVNLAPMRTDAQATLRALLKAGLGRPPANSSAPVASEREPATPATPTAPAEVAAAPQPAPEPAPALPAAPPPAATAPPQPAPRKPSAAGSNAEPFATIREVIADVEAVRGLHRKNNLRVEVLDDDDFSRTLREKAARELTPAVLDQERARWLAFGLAPASANPGEILRTVLDEQVAGFYDPRTHSLTVRKNLPLGLGPDGLRLVLAHEIEHALQDQSFGLTPLATLPDEDVRLARTALYEGDAMATMLAYAAARAHKPIKPAILDAAQAMRGQGTQALLQQSGFSSALLAAPEILREELVMPYSAGLGLVAEVYTRGGFPLVDKMFAHPPLSSHQVLHPEAYLQGELPFAIPQPPLPPGTKLLSSGRMGELASRIALSQCVDKQVVAELADRWAGDAYVISQAADKSLTLVWRSAWSGDTSAPIANVLQMSSPCWDEHAAEKTFDGWTISGAHRIREAGGKVVLVRGLPEAQLTAALNSALRFEPRAQPHAAPLGALAQLKSRERAKVAGGRFTSVRLGLEGSVPPGFDVTTEDASDPNLELQLRPVHSDVPALLQLRYLAAVDDEAREAFLTSSAIALSKRVKGGGVAVVGTQTTTIAAAEASERTFRFEDSPAKARIALQPLCGGKAFLAVVRLGTEENKGPGDRFVEGLERKGEPAVCAELE